MSWYANLKIRVKLLVGFIILTCISIFIGVFAMNEMQGLSAGSIELFERRTQPLSYVSYMTNDFLTIRVGARDVINATDPTALRNGIAVLQGATSEIDKYIKAYKSTINREIEMEALKELEKIVYEYIEKIDLLIQAKNANKTREADSILSVSLPYGNQAIASLKKLTDMNVEYASARHENNIKRASSTQILMVIIVVICAVVSIILALYIASVIGTPLRLMEENAQQIAKTGDLTTTADVNLNDEVGHVNTAMKLMITNFGNLIRKVIAEMDHINKESEELSAISIITANASVELQAQTQTASSSSEQISANVSTVASSVEELSASIKEIAKNTTSATDLTKESENRANQASEVMNRLGESSQEIGNIVKSITGIAEQTNLLALNATIEAARAGEMGKGFAVVANEVKELAKESAKATEDITHKIKTIQDDTKNAITVIQGIIENAVRINEITTSIASAVEEQSVTANEVNRNIGEATIGVSSIVEVITGIMQAVNDYAQQANKIKVTSAELQTLANDLDHEIKDNFKV